MAESQYPFEYSPDEEARLRASLSEVRLGKYLEKANFRFDLAMDYYLWNARIAKSLQFPLNVMEVTVRNAVCEHFSLCGAPDEWGFDDVFIQKLAANNPEARTSLNRSKRGLLKDLMNQADFETHVELPGHLNTPSLGLINTNDVIAKMSLEFWLYPDRRRDGSRHG